MQAQAIGRAGFVGKGFGTQAHGVAAGNGRLRNHHGELVLVVFVFIVVVVVGVQQLPAASGLLQRNVLLAAGGVLPAEQQVCTGSIVQGANMHIHLAAIQIETTRRVHDRLRCLLPGVVIAITIQHRQGRGLHKGQHRLRTAIQHISKRGATQSRHQRKGSTQPVSCTRCDDLE